MFAKLVMTSRWHVLQGEDRLWGPLANPLLWPTWCPAARSAEAAQTQGPADFLVGWSSPWGATVPVPLRLSLVDAAGHIECHFGTSRTCRANLILDRDDEQPATLTLRIEIRFSTPLARSLAPLLSPAIKLLCFRSVHRALAQLGRQIGATLTCTEQWAGLHKKFRAPIWRP